MHKIIVIALIIDGVNKVNPSAFKKGGAITKRPMGGKVYKVDNSGQDMIKRMYGGKLGF